MENGIEPTTSLTLTSHNPTLQLPVSCDPPGVNNPAKQLVWVVSEL